jgi:hypothetical protein
MLFSQLSIDGKWGFRFWLILVNLVRLYIIICLNYQVVGRTVQLALFRSEQTIASNLVSFNDLPRAFAC